MAVTKYRFRFDAHVSLAEAERTLHMVVLAIEGLYGRARVRLEVRYNLDESQRAIVLESGSAVGLAVVRVFTSLLQYEFGDTSFTVRQVRPHGGEVEGAVA